MARPWHKRTKVAALLLTILAGVAFTPQHLFGSTATPAQGWWYDSDLGYLNATGPELVTNGDFSSGTGWSGAATWTVTGGVAVATNAASGDVLSQTVSLLSPGKVYDVTYTITEYTAGTVAVKIGGALGTSRTAVGTYREVIVCSTTTLVEFSSRTAGTSLSIDNISVKECTNVAAGCTMYQDSTGVTPVTAVEQPVGLQLDKRYGLVRGSELFVDGGMSSSDGWTLENGWTVSSGKLNYAATGTGRDAYKTLTTTAGKSYELTFTVDSMSAGQLGAYSPESSNITSASFSASTGARRYVLVATGASMTVRLRTSATGSGNIVVDDISVREIPGNHRLQATSASRPTLSARYNLLTKSEQFDDAAWTKTNLTVPTTNATAPDGTTTADRLVETVTNGAHIAQQTFTSSVASYIASARFKAGERTIGVIRLYDGSTATGHATYFNLGTGAVGTNAAGNTATITAQADGWYLCTVTRTLGASAGSLTQFGMTEADGTLSYAGDITKGLYIWGADLRLTTDATGKGPAYQRVNTSTDYDTNGFLVNEDFDGVDDSYTGTTGGGGTTGFFYCAAHRIDGGAGTVRTLFSDRGTNTGYRVCINASNKLELSAGNGVAFTTVESAATLSVGSTYVIAAWHDGVNLYVQINQGAIASTAFATATAGSASFTVGKSNTAASEFLNGLLYGDIYVQNGGVSDTNRAKTQRWLANRSGVTL